MKRISLFMLLLCIPLLSFAQRDTIWVSTLFTTHVLFATDITYADMSNSQSIAGKVVEQNRNMIALKARTNFQEPCSVSALESNGRMWTFVLMYKENPSDLIIDTRISEQTQAAEGRKPARGSHGHLEASKEQNASTWKNGRAPMLEDVAKLKQEIYHIGQSQYDIRVLCENIFAHSDITYMVFSLTNSSGISYSINDATFVIESKRQTKRTVSYDETVFPRSRYGSLSAGPGTTTRMVYSFDKMTLSKDQVLRIYLYESGGQRNLVMTIDPSDINKAKNLK